MSGFHGGRWRAGGKLCFGGQKWLREAFKAVQHLAWCEDFGVVSSGGFRPRSPARASQTGACLIPNFHFGMPCGRSRASRGRCGPRAGLVIAPTLRRATALRGAFRSGTSERGEKCGAMRDVRGVPEGRWKLAGGVSRREPPDGEKKCIRPGRGVGIPTLRLPTAPPGWNACIRRNRWSIPRKTVAQRSRDREPPPSAHVRISLITCP